MNRSLLYLLVCLSLLLPLESRAKGDCYSDCIIGYKIDWTGVKDHDEGYKVISSIHNKAYDLELKTGTHGYLRSIQEVKVQNNSKLYIRFRKSCKNKEPYTKYLFDYWRTLSKNIPEFTRLPDPIIPSKYTISKPSNAQCRASIPQEMKVNPTNPASECLIGYNLDWAGIKAPEKGQLFNFHSADESDFWQGKNIPDFARYVRLYAPPLSHISNVEGGLPKEIYFYISHKQYCAKKESLTKQYFDFWHSRGLELPHITRISDPIEPFTQERTHAQIKAMKALAKSAGLSTKKKLESCLLGVNFEWENVPLKELNRSISYYPSRDEREWWDKEIPEFVLAITPINYGYHYDKNMGIIRKFYEVDWEYCFKKEKLWNDYIAYIRGKYEWVPKYEIMSDDASQKEMEEFNAKSKLDEQELRQSRVIKFLPAPVTGKQSQSTSGNCLIAFDYDWTGVKISEVKENLRIYYGTSDAKNIWGDNMPDYAKYVTGYVMSDKHSNERLLPTRMYFFIENTHCDKKEEYALQYMEFWRSRGAIVPEVKRVLDSEVKAPIE